jgi:hypothetical protein
MAEYKAQGGVLGGREERTDSFNGESRAVGSALGEGGNHTLGGPGARGTTTVTDGGMNGRNDAANGRNGVANSGVRDGINGNGVTGRDKDVADSRTTGTVMAGSSTGIASAMVQKASLKDKLNPKVDADGDGKAGIMD